MHRNMLWAILLVAALTVTAITVVLIPDRPSGVHVSEADPTSLIADLESSAIVNVSATVLDAADTIEDMTAEADLIAIGHVVSRRQHSPVAVAVSVTLQRVLKGSYAGNELTIFQLGTLDAENEHLLNEGTQYLLFLGKQTDGQPHTFYIKGGDQGIFFADGDMIGGRDPRFVSAVSSAGVTGPGLSALETHVLILLNRR